ncbi:unnamed protein product [Triticum turgidum subsp. durum]|uniref:Uncharacterized protein n=1 Tax=Triticum turgidum subsp. durum TaxID=4567 RepID=A0A9R0U1N1_TRITD|nr:unnamed protein product [Triticum turgidum subsp. durum]
MGVGMKRAREEEPVVSLALSLSTDSPTTSSTTSDNSTGVPAAAARKRTRRGRVVSTSGEGEFVCKTCGHMRRHREEMAVRSGSAIDRWVALTDQEARHQDGVLLELFV